MVEWDFNAYLKMRYVMVRRCAVISPPAQHSIHKVKSKQTLGLSAGLRLLGTEVNDHHSIRQVFFILEQDLIYFLSRLYYVRTCLGLEVLHDEGAEEEVRQFIFSMNEVLAGLLYMYDTVWDWSREALGGALKD